MKQIDKDKLRKILEDRQRIEDCRADFSRFFEYVKSWNLPPFQVEICHKLQLLEATPDKKLIYSLPPSSGKTEMLIAFTVWALGRFTEGMGEIDSIAYCSYSGRLPKNTSLAIRNMIMYDGKVKEIFPKLELETEAILEWRIKNSTSKDPAFFCTSVGGSITGLHFKLLLMDDCIADFEQANSEKYLEELISYWDWTWKTRVEVGTRFVVSNTRWTQFDLINHLIATDKHKEWEVVNYPAIVEGEDGEVSYWEWKYPLVQLLDLREKNSLAFSALYQGQPIPATGVLIDRAWLKEVELEDLPEMERVICSWDTAITESKQADYTVGLRIGYAEGKFYVLDMIRRKIDFTKLIGYIEDFGNAGEAILIEEQGPSGIAALQTLKQLASVKLKDRSIIGRKTKGKSKYDRLTSLSHIFEGGKVYFVNDSNKKLEVVKNELVGFPRMEYDDCVDSLVMGLKYLESGLYGIKTACNAEYIYNRSHYAGIFGDYYESVDNWRQ